MAERSSSCLFMAGDVCGGSRRKFVFSPARLPRNSLVSSACDEMLQTAVCRVWGMHYTSLITICIDIAAWRCTWATALTPLRVARAT